MESNNLWEFFSFPGEGANLQRAFVLLKNSFENKSNNAILLKVHLKKEFVQTAGQ
jgi:hypothetical protein